MGFGDATTSAIARMAALVILGGCHSLADLDVRYQEGCVQPRIPYVEQFDEGRQGLIDRCWELRNVDGAPGGAGGEGGAGVERTLVVKEDLILGYKNEAGVRFDDEPPMLLRRVQGNFGLVTHVEATDTLTSSLCLAPGDSAGIIVRDAVTPQKAAAFLLRPYLEGGAGCEEGA